MVISIGCARNVIDLIKPAGVIITINILLR